MFKNISSSLTPPKDNLSLKAMVHMKSMIILNKKTWHMVSVKRMKGDTLK